MKQWKWPLAWLVQILEMLAISLAAAALDLAGPAVYAIAAWVLVPLAGLLTACRTTRRGLLNYAAWIAPPVCMWLGHWILWRYSPSAGAVIFCALTSLVGAAAGEVLKQRKK